MSQDAPFIMEVECRVWDIEDEIAVGDGSYVYPSSFVGSVSLSSRDVSLTDDEIFELLDTAHAHQSFVRRFLEMHNSYSRCLEKLGVSGDVDFDDAWVNCQVSESYLVDVVQEREGGEKVLESLAEFDTPVEVWSGEWGE